MAGAPSQEEDGRACTVESMVSSIDSFHREGGHRRERALSHGLSLSTTFGAGLSEIPEAEFAAPSQLSFSGACHGAGPWRHWLQKILSSSSFELLLGIVIFVNCISIGVEVQYMAREGATSTPEVFLLLDISFALVFLLELLLRLCVQRWYFFKSDDWAWNMLDTLIVMASMVELAASIALLLHTSTGVGAAGVSSNLRTIRVLRLARLGRTLRIPRLIRFVYALRTLVYSICATLQSLVWAFMLLTILVYSFGIVFTLTSLDYMAEETANGREYDPLLKKFWGTLPDAMFTLFKSISGGLDWEDAVTPLVDVSMVLASLFCIFIFFTYFAVLNVITGIFCNSAIEAAERDPDLVVQALVASKKAYEARLRKLFQRVDTDSSGFLTLQEFQSIMAQDDVKAYFSALHVDIADAWALFKLMDTDRNGAISIDEFVWGCLRLKGSAKATDIALLMHDSRWIAKRLSRLAHYTEAQFKKLDDALSGTQPVATQTAAMVQCTPGAAAASAGADPSGCPRPPNGL
uniref:EF-hand domain-containing protein n=1 Tax=Pyrodinium bahamense TaxID=73915 RepID=A0A7R9ZYM9_9DINO